MIFSENFAFIWNRWSFVVPIDGINRIGKVVVTPRMESGVFKFYFRYINNTLVLIQYGQIGKILKALSSFNNNLWFTVDRLENEDVCTLHTFKDYE